MEKSKLNNTVDKGRNGHVVIVTSVPFPNGFAPANRIMAYAKGFTENNYSCEVVVIKPNIEKSNKGFKTDGVFEDVKYKFPGNIINANEKNILIRQFQYQYSVIKSLLYIVYNTLIKKQSDIIIYYGTDVFVELQLTILSHLFNVVILTEQSEKPLLYNSEKLLPKSIVKFLYYKIIFKRYTGILAMTVPIRAFFCNIGIPADKILLISHTVSLHRFEGTMMNSNEQYYAFTGSLNEQKDGVLSLLDSLAIVKLKYPEIKLKVAGYGSEIDVELFRQKIKDLGLFRNVDYLGSLQGIDAIKLIQNARALVSFRPSSIQAEYGFPTKVVEYLATGNPVITTLTGDLRLFLINNENSFTTSPGDIEGFAKQWIIILQDFDSAKKVGAQGKELVMNVFNPKIQTKKIISYYMNLNQ